MTQNQQRILVVDADEPHRLEVQRLLTEVGYDVASLSSGGEAWEVSRRSPAGILLIDWVLPDELDGLRLSDRLRRLDPTSKTLLMATVVSEVLQASCHSSRVAALLAKPLDADQTIRTVTELAALRARHLGPCVGCRFRLPLLKPASEENAAVWRCGICQHHYRAEFDPTFPAELHTYVERVA